MPSSTAQAAPLRNIHDLTPHERADLMRAVWSRESRFQSEFGADQKYLDGADFGEVLSGEIMRILKAKGVIPSDVPLAELHLHIEPSLMDYNYDDGVNKISTYLYDTDAQFEANYHRFIKECVQKHFPYAFYFQATPTIRIHCPGGANANHYPRYHTDVGYGHPPEEINLWMPLTAPVPPQQHGFRLANLADSRAVLERFGFDFAPFIDRAINDKPFNAELDAIAPQVDAPFGTLLAFDSRCIHTGEPLEHHTRASMDVRIVPVADYESIPVEYQGTGRRRVRYAPGAGYHTLTSREL